MITVNMNIEITILFGKQTEKTTPPKDVVKPDRSQSKLTTYDEAFKRGLDLATKGPRGPNSGTRTDKHQPHFSSCCGTQGRRCMKKLDYKCYECYTGPLRRARRSEGLSWV